MSAPDPLTVEALVEIARTRGKAAAYKALTGRTPKPPPPWPRLPNPGSHDESGTPPPSPRPRTTRGDTL